jgi:hypothetical protein
MLLLLNPAVSMRALYMIQSLYCRCCIIGSITGNRNTLAGNIPPQADLGQLQGFEAGFKYPNVMINSGGWEAPKAYKDAKARVALCALLCDRSLCVDAAG